MVYYTTSAKVRPLKTRMKFAAVVAIIFVFNSVFAQVLYYTLSVTIDLKNWNEKKTIFLFKLYSNSHRSWYTFAYATLTTTPIKF